MKPIFSVTTVSRAIMHVLVFQLRVYTAIRLHVALFFQEFVFGLPEAPKNFYLPNFYHRHSDVHLEISISLTVNGAFKRFGDNFKR